MAERRLAVADLGTVPYGAALERQRGLAEDRIAGRQADDLLLLLEHPPVVTLGRGDTTLAEVAQVIVAHAEQRLMEAPKAQA